MKTLLELLKEIEVKERLSRIWHKKFSGVSEKISQLKDEIKQQIKNGKSLGDPLKDFIFLRYGQLNNREIEGGLRALQEKFKDYLGQYILVVQTEKERFRWGGPGDDRPGDYINKTILNVGVLSGDAFIFSLSDVRLSFPTDGKYAICKEEDRFKDEKPILVMKGDFMFSSLEDVDLQDSSDLQILMGDEAIARWFVNNTSYLWILCELNYTFGKSIVFPEFRMYVEQKKIELLEELNLLKAQKELLSIERKKFERLGRSNSAKAKAKEMSEISQKMNKIIAKAGTLGVGPSYWEKME